MRQFLAISNFVESNFFEGKGFVKSGKIFSAEDVNEFHAKYIDGWVKIGSCREIDFSKHFPVDGKLVPYSEMSEDLFQEIGDLSQKELYKQWGVHPDNFMRFVNAWLDENKRRNLGQVSGLIVTMELIAPTVMDVTLDTGHQIRLTVDDEAIMVGDILSWWEGKKDVYWMKRESNEEKVLTAVCIRT